jgi:hypothetical protein
MWVDKGRPDGRSPDSAMTHQDAVATLATERYLLEEMNDAERDRFEAHFFDCAECADDLRVADRIRLEARKGLTAPAAAAPAPVIAIRRRAWRPAMVLPWAAAASLAAVIGYQSFVTMPALRDGTRPQGLSPVMLRGGTRGADVVVPIAAGQVWVTLAADVRLDAPVQRLQFELFGPAGDTLTSGLAPVPASGMPLMVLVPADHFDDEGAHRMVVNDPDRPQAPLGEYRFVITR